MVKKTSKILNSFDDLAKTWLQSAKKQADNVRKGNRPRTKSTKTSGAAKTIGAERVYTSDPVSSPIEFKESTLVKDLLEGEKKKAMEKELLVKETLRDLDHSLNHIEQISGQKIPAWNKQMMRKVIEQYPTAFNRTPMPINPVYPKYKSNDFGIADYFTPEDYAKVKGITTINTTPAGWTPTYQTSPVVSVIPDYFKPQQYRGIDNIDTMFEQAGSMYALDAPHAARQFLSAGLKDVAAMARGFKPTSFKYKPHYGIVPKSVIEEIVTRRNAPIGTVEWLQKINRHDPTNNASYLDLFAKHPNYFKKMYDIDGKPIK